MENLSKYTVAGHTFSICLPEGMAPETYLKPYEPFVETSDIEPLFVLTLKTVSSLKELKPGKVLECLNDEAPYFWMLEQEDGTYNFGFSYSKSCPDCIVKPAKDLREAIVYIRENQAVLAEFAVNNAMMLLYTFCTTPLDTLMVHASVIASEGKGYMFLGKSGTGKSTHSSLWLKYIDGTELLNDDNPVIRLVDGKVYVYGTPWSGKTPCYKNMSMPLGAFVRLSQAPYNKISQVRGLSAFASLMPACSCMRWDSASLSHLYKTVEKVIAVVPAYQLECLPDEDAARVCHSQVTQ